MKVLAENNGYKLIYDGSKVNRYIVYHTLPMSPSGELKLEMMVTQSPILTKKIKSYFTQQQVQAAIAKVHAITYVNKKFKA